MVASLIRWWRARGARVPPAIAPRWLAAGALRGARQGARVVSDPTRTVRLAFVAPTERVHAARARRSALLRRAQTALAVTCLGVVVALWLGWLIDGAPRSGAPASRTRSEQAIELQRSEQAIERAARPEPPPATRPRPAPTEAITRIELSPAGTGTRELHVLTLADLPDIGVAELDPCMATVRLSDVPSAVSATR